MKDQRNGLKGASDWAFQVYTPAPPLSRFVAALWHHDSDAETRGKDRILPSGAMQIVIRLRDDAPLRTYATPDTQRADTFGSAVVTGLYTTPFAIDTVGRDTILGIVFKPGGAFPFLGCPSSELRDLHVGLDDLWGREAGELRERLLATQDVQARFRLVESWLLRRSSEPLARHPAVSAALRHLDGNAAPLPIEELAATIGLTKRRLGDVFAAQVGVTPKVFARMQRFHVALRAMPRGPVDWADLALTHGFYDQAHFANEFKSFSGLTPTAYQAQRGEHLHHVSLSSNTGDEAET